ncbi:FAD-dependent oxidoreductase [Mycobacteroides franklinii]|uniref:Dihydrolipoamide dehydrogenase n=1 Tax=Mycobacteroides franklinii TaxID=948102 RepID=A0A4R8QXI3_9MYCO|nr:FAD-dependent oxidoreductase [Mycobacteroides franklinii]TDZ45121.1 dihydrolipoamide dehydrogenase [Mycobacteroides franklinii]TDZ48611.1 dihydrolipoamide dehydrogenase [Mycobacteroides franklinii]TDZ58791.1 dihydrolipoamide dehydrogenase [Mycobacteroides franklinii]TDZ66307.1 dihydrolipoamide dehydrogenase [Mycobacteroides franklinii]TDZ72230.1 dihydrolipoamide dehydrogenase [Mycobacteroides franklinii]
MSRRRVVVAGLGDSGLLTAIQLARHNDVVGLSAKPGLVSGQELGVRLSRPDEWTRNYWIPFERFRALDGVRTLHATLTGVNLGARTVFAQNPDGSALTEPYDTLIISTGVSNGFWRQPSLQSSTDVAEDLRAAHQRLISARSVIVIGGGAAAVSSAANLAMTWPNLRVDLYFPGERALTQHAPRVWDRIRRRLNELHVGLHPGHRALIPEGFACDRITDQPVQWISGQSPASAGAVVWATGRVRPNTDWLPPELRDEHGFVRVTPQLQVPGHRNIFAVGDVAATDPLRASARNRADHLVAHNVRAAASGRPMRTYRPAAHRWGSVLGAQPDGLEVFAPSGHAFRFPAWSVERVLQPWIVSRGIYRGIRDTPRKDSPA